MVQDAEYVGRYTCVMLVRHFFAIVAGMFDDVPADIPTCH